MKLVKVGKSWDRHVAYGLIPVIKGYQTFVSPLLGNRCRFYPSCSEYSSQALQKYGTILGFQKTLVRLCKCHPYHPGGIDLP